MVRIIPTSLILLALLVAEARTGHAATVTLTPVKDSTLYEDALGALANGAGEHFFIGRVGAGGGGKVRRALLQFNLAGNIPAGSTVNTSTLILFCNRTSSGPVTVSAHKLTSDWTEGTTLASGDEGSGGAVAGNDATWLHRTSTGTLWTSVGGDFSPTPSASVSVNASGTTYNWSGAPMVADVQAWLASPAQNFGWLLKTDETALGTAKRFGSRITTPANAQPTLTIDFTPPAAIEDWSLY